MPPERGSGTAGGLGRLRWPVERSMAWLKRFRRLRTRHERRLDTCRIMTPGLPSKCTLPPILVKLTSYGSMDTNELKRIIN